MNKIVKVVISFLLILSIGFVISNQQAEASSLVDSSKITTTSTSLSGNVGGTTKICLRAEGLGWFYNPVVSIYNDGSYVTQEQIGVGDCISFNAGSTKNRSFTANVSRLSVPGTFYFDLYN
ncbi:hypothetical protein FOH38_05120 [Lysinibacillus fusiformis]|nr:hypothetical protein FOH38_05120 [Lysinibacillus fusiformis]